MVTIEKVLVIFKTHLDIGFTDFGENVRRKYIEQYIPKALETAKKLRGSRGEERFVWTTGSWLINQYIQTLNEEQYEEFAEQVRAGDVRWHALPFTSHTELMDAELFETGIGLSKELDERFGVKTIACKMTDVPGHTRAIVPFLAKAGVEFMHIGVNPASAVPVVPPLFRWTAPTGEAITVMYHSVYGSCSPLGDSGAAIYFAHAGDNLSPPSPEDVKKVFSELREKFPGAKIVASDLSAVAEILRSEVDKMPVITDEIGDSWIHGVGTDPGKVSRFRSLLRYRDGLKDDMLRVEFNRKLLPIPEHTWGLDEKTHLNDHANFTKEEFNAVRNTAPYQKMEQSWREQRAYLTSALSVLPRQERAVASVYADSYKKASVLSDIKTFKEESKDTVFEIGDYTFSFSDEGAVNLLKYNGKKYADETHKLAQWSYTQFGPEDYERFFRQYIRCDEEWALEDYDKIGMAASVEHRYDYLPKLDKIYRKGNTVTAIMVFSDEAVKRFGCPEWTETTIEPMENELFVDVAWFNKTANRRAEMINIGFASFTDDLKISKLGEFIEPNILKNGNHNLHASDWGVKYSSLEINSLDAALVSIGKPAILDYENKDFDRSQVWFNLYNNQWGTNFPMWYEEDARFRFVVKLK